MLFNARKRSGMQSLHKQCANAANQRGNVTMDNPRRIMRKVKSTVFTGLNGIHPWWNAIFSICDDSAKSGAKAFL
jgi:hypothetical protein